MSANTPERFREVEPLRDAGGLLMAHIWSKTQWIYLIAKVIDIDEARALRDWLTKALPEEIVDPTPCWCPYCGEPHGVHQSKEKP